MSPFLVEQAGGAANLTNDQRALIVGASTLLGGLTAGLAGQNAQGGATAAANESLNNSTGDHRTEEEKAQDAIKAQKQKEAAALGQGRTVKTEKWRDLCDRLVCDRGIGRSHKQWRSDGGRTDWYVA
ncbi:MULTISPECIES: VENN motif pre-toxin domain-containing protein [Burkholderiaceae]|uniref:VENN motif pre-toxin domain-containing protein n=1 Tax=Burkholderiaceae TaxID=119060 RepID=UPI000418245F|nr:VENN motif pre-toxin domain-containing protein [Burkholderia sp. WSM2232]